MTPRGTDWSLALLVGVVLATGALTAFAGDPGDRWVFTVHGIASGALALLLIWKLRRVVHRLATPERRMLPAALTLGVVAASLATGWLWAATPVSFGGFRVLAWHWALGAVLALPFAAHLIVRAKPLRRRDVADRRQFLEATGVVVIAAAVWQVQRPLARALGLRGHERRFTGSYETGSFAGNDFPVTSWVADDPLPIDAAEYRLRVGDRELALEDLDAGDEVVATLDCTGGFYSTQRWRGTRLDRLLGADPPSHVRVVSHTGYRWSFSTGDAPRLLLATHVGGEPLSHGHGAPLRLVAPGRRGFQWVKWVTAIELHDGPDPGAAASTVLSSFSPEGRGRRPWRRARATAS